MELYIHPQIPPLGLLVPLPAQVTDAAIITLIEKDRKSQTHQKKMLRCLVLHTPLVIRQILQPLSTTASSASPAAILPPPPTSLW